jgi:hypothetical protein
VCFYLYVLGNKEQQIFCKRQRQVDSNSEKVTTSDEGSEDNSNKDSEGSEAAKTVRTAKAEHKAERERQKQKRDS